MKLSREDIYDGITNIPYELIVKSDEYKPTRKKTHRKLWVSSVAAVLAIAVALGALLRPQGNSYVISEAEYPKMAAYPQESDYTNFITGDIDEAYYEAYDAWLASVEEQLNQPEGYADGLESFLSASIQQFLSDSEGNNAVYSPLNVYMALAMLAELADGDSRQQILDLLGAESIDDLREQAQSVWNANYRNDGATASILASSAWLNQDVDFIQSTMDTLADNYYASSYQGEMGSDELNAALREWINEQTGGLLKEQASGLELSADTVLALVTTIYFQSKWRNEFSESNTASGTFHSADGDITCDFMNQSGNDTLYWGDSFSAVAKSLESGGNMLFILPDEGVSVDDLLADEQLMDFILSDEDWEYSKYLTVNLSVPKFDVCSNMELSDGLKALGVTDVFDSAEADFSSMTQSSDGICVSSVNHAVRVAIDEEGCTAASYTAALTTGSAMPIEDEVDFVLDRPFLFVITGADGLPLFVGVVNQPN